MSTIPLTGTYQTTIALTAGNTDDLSGKISPQGFGGDGVYSDVSNAGLIVERTGYITGAQADKYLGIAGDGVDLTTPGAVTNFGTLYGGKSPSTFAGGTGVALEGGTLTNELGAIIRGGGNDYRLGPFAAGPGGIGVAFDNAAVAF